MTNDIFVKRFVVSDQKLSDTDKKVLEKLEKAVELIGGIYALQFNDQYPGANFYPHDATKDEILRAAEDNREILSPYTVVERDFNKNLISIPYHIKYSEQLKPIITLLREATKLTNDSNLAKGLDIQAKALEEGLYIESESYWLKMKPSNIGLLIGPIERYDDQLFYKKTSYLGVVGVMLEQATKDANSFKDAMVTLERKSFSFARRVEMVPHFNIRVDTASMLSGLAVNAFFSGYNLPNDPKQIEQHGVNLTILDNIIIRNFEELHYPIFKKVFQKDFQNGYTKDQLIESARYLLLTRIIAGNLIKYHNVAQRLGELLPVIEEMAFTVIAIKNAGLLLVKDVISQKVLEGMIVLYICQAFDLLIASKDNKSLESYRLGAAIVLNYFLESGAMREQKGVSWVNFTKIFISLSELAILLEQLLAFGDREDAKHLIDKYGKTDHLLSEINI